jgi:hypothetical protein
MYGLAAAPHKVLVHEVRRRVRKLSPNLRPLWTACGYTHGHGGTLEWHECSLV